MNIYFAGSIRGGRDDQELYYEIIEQLKKYGQVVSEFIGDKALTSQGSAGLTNQEIYERDVNLIDRAEWIVAEVTNPSLGVGYELGYGEATGKNILCLYRPQEGKKLSAMVAGNSYFRVHEYSSAGDIPEILKNIFAK